MPIVLGSYDEFDDPRRAPVVSGPPDRGGNLRALAHAAKMAGPMRVRTYRMWWPTIAGQIRYLRKGIDQWRGRLWTRRLAVELIRDRCDEKDQLCQAITLAQAVRARLYYVNERPELFQIPSVTWWLGFGDCDDFTWLLGALIESVGIPVEVDGMKLNGKWKHVFPVAMIPVKGTAKRARIPLDATLKARLGTNPVSLALRKGFKVETYRLKSKVF